jgi:hypothetical protein
MKKIILIVIALIVISGVSFWIYLSISPNPSQACINAGGTVATSSCCGLTSDFPNLCLIGACGCSPSNSKETKICDCGTDKCFNGTACVSFQGDKGSEINNNNSTVQDMKIEILKEGTGEAAKNNDTVSVHYTGVLENGTKFDSSLDRGTPFSFTLGAGQVIKGWDLGILGMKVGEQRKLTIPYDLAYGEAGYGPIPAKATLIFDVELLGINQ